VKPHYVIVSDYLVPTDSEIINTYHQNWHMLPQANISADAVNKTLRSNFDSGANIVLANADNSNTQLLDGYQAMGVCRYRSGYTDGDLGRMQTQRAFMEALLRQTVLGDCFTLQRLFRKEVQSDLTAANYLWLARALLMTKPGTVEGATLPGSSLKVEGSICTVLDPAFVVQTVNAYCNPYMKDVSVEHLTIETP